MTLTEFGLVFNFDLNVRYVYFLLYDKTTICDLNKARDCLMFNHFLYKFGSKEIHNIEIASSKKNEVMIAIDLKGA